MTDWQPRGLEADRPEESQPDSNDATNGAGVSSEAQNHPESELIPAQLPATAPDDGAAEEPGAGPPKPTDEEIEEAASESAPEKTGAPQDAGATGNAAGPGPGESVAAPPTVPGAPEVPTVPDAPDGPDVPNPPEPAPAPPEPIPEPAPETPEPIPAPAETPGPIPEPAETPEPIPEPAQAHPEPIPEPAPRTLEPARAPPEADFPGTASPALTHAEIASARPLPRAVAIANQKGGVGKTTTAVNLGAGLAEIGYRVLVVDLDPQGNATTGLGVNPRNLTGSVYDVLMNDAPLEDCIEPTAVKNLFVVPATIDLAGAEIELVPTFSRELKLRRAIDRLAGDFDFTLIDCPPSLGLLTVNGLAAAGEVLVPIQCEYYALEGLGQLIKNIQLVQSNLNPRLELSTIVLTMYDARTRLSDQVAKDVREHFGAKVCRTIVPRTVRLSEAPSFGQPINVFDPSSRGATAYRELAKEVSGGTARRSG